MNNKWHNWDLNQVRVGSESLCLGARLFWPPAVLCCSQERAFPVGSTHKLGKNV